MIQRTFIPGSQWVYLKFYTGQKTSDRILIKVIDPILRKLQKENYLEKWFFIRYWDPDFHLRVRLQINDSQYIGYIIQLFYEKMYRWNQERLLWKVQLDTYEREIERYGKHLIEEAESVFYADSQCVLSIIKKLDGNDNYRWMISLKLIDQLLSDFCLTINDKRNLMERLSKSFKVEFGFNEFNSKEFNIKFRDNKKIVECVLNNMISEKSFVSLLQPIKKRTQDLLVLTGQIKVKSAKENRLADLLTSYMHMTMNRLFLSRNREHEMIIYDFLFRYYSGEIARQKYIEE